ncbi:hypothetical protein [Shinella sp. BYT-45]|uniref:hypothetical protein n=1 Tax=Shinella sp. BYT-45 TaxID=3377377 RepID=UPI00397F9611
MANIPVFPHCVLRPRQISANLVAFTRGGGRTLGGLDPATRTDLGFWSIEYGNVVLRNRDRAQWQTWQAISQMLGGRSGRIAVPVRSGLSAPYVSGRFEEQAEVPHDDGSPFSDGSEYEQGAISIVTEGVTPIGATQIRLRIINAADNLVGVRFSYRHALYETGPVMDIDGDVWTVPISPSVRETIPAGADLEFDEPTCLCRLSEDRGMDIAADAIGKFASPSISFTEDTDYWYRLARGLI